MKRDFARSATELVDTTPRAPGVSSSRVLLPLFLISDNVNATSNREMRSTIRCS